MAVKIGSLFGEVVIDTRKMEKGLKRASRKLRAFGRNASSAGKAMAVGVGAPLTGIGVVATKTFASFEQEMAKVKAISGATGDTFTRLENLAKDLGESTRFTAGEVAGLQLNLSKLGFTPKEIEKVTEATLDLALATGEDLAESARVAAGTLRGFGMEADEMTRVTDVMAASFSSSALDLNKFTTAMSIVAPVAKNAGASIEEATAMIAVLADANMDASTAGTSLRNIFLTTAEQGMTFREAMDQIQRSTNKNVTALELFGKRGATAATIIAENIDKAKGLTSAFRESQGAASEMAAVMDDTVTGSFFRLRSAVEGTMIAFMESGGKDSGLQQLLDRMSELILANQDLIIAKAESAAKVAAFIAVLGGGFFTLGQFSLLLNNMIQLHLLNVRIITASVIPAILKMRKAFVIAALAIQLSIAPLLAAKAAIVAVAGVLLGIKLNDEFDLLKKAMDALGIESDELENSLSGLGETTKELASESKELSNAIENMKTPVVETSDATANMATNVDLLANSSEKASRELQQLKGEALNLFDEMKSAHDEKMKLPMEDVLRSIDEYTQKNKTVNQAISEFGESGMSAAEMVQHAMERASDGMTDSLMRFFNDGKVGLKEFAADFLQEMQRMFIQTKIINPLLADAAGLMGGFSEGTVGFLKGAFAPRAMGGSVAPNKPYMVGEKGRELFVPQSAGTIIPNDELGGGGTTINFNVQAIDSQSFGSALVEHRAQITGIVENAYRMRGKRGVLTA